ncbi:hypothetical protein [Brevibacterium oceani]|uniref:hypothetical protein n=1 Tax=Brevibacterium oceani TaxID=358099 RepID=UPI0015E7D057|nr:hypothetical protein [Brevibacterium oceani]
MASGFKINKQGIRKMTREIEREFAKNPVKVPLEADPRAVSLPAATTVHNYHGPVVTVSGDHAQIAWGDGEVHQTQNRVEQVAPGYEELARLVTDLLANLPTFSLDEADEAEIRSNAETVLNEVTKVEPDQGVIKRGLTMLKGILAPVGAGLGRAVTEESAEAAREVIEGLGDALPF